MDVRAIPPIPPSERDDASAVCSTTVSWTSSWRSSAAAPFIDCAPACSTSDRFAAAASLLATAPVDETVWLVTESAAADLADLCRLRRGLRAGAVVARRLLHHRLPADGEIRRDRPAARRPAAGLANDLDGLRDRIRQLHDLRELAAHWREQPVADGPSWTTVWT